MDVLTFITKIIWPVAISIMGIVFRNELKELVRMVGRVTYKKGDSELILEKDKSENEQSPSQIPEQLDKSDDSEHNEIDDVSSSHKPEIYDAIMKLIDGEEEEALIIFNTIQAEITEKNKKIENESLFLLYRYFRGYENSIPEIETLINTTEDKDLRSLLLHRIAKCYDYGSNIELAQNYYRKAIDTTPKLFNKIKYSIDLAKSNKSDLLKGLAELQDWLDKTLEKEEKILLFTGLAELYEEVKDYEKVTISLFNIVDLKPNDTGILFKIGYALSEINLDLLSSLYYTNLLKFNPENSVALNNQGVSFSRLGFKFKSIEYFRKSLEKDFTLAASNIAYDYMNSGFFEDAKQILDAAITKNQVHENVPKAISALQEKKENEEKSYDSLLVESEIVNIFMKEYAKAYFNSHEKFSTTKDDQFSFLGKNSINLKFFEDQSKLEIEWIEKNYHRKLVGSIVNRSIKIKFFKEGSSYLSTKDDINYLESGEGFGFQTDDQKIKILDLSDRKKPNYFEINIISV